MKRHIRKAIARIDVTHDGKNISRGTGFLVTERLVLTALHVVANRRSDPPEPFPGTITLQFPGHTTQAQIYEQFFDRSADWVLLKCVDPPQCPPIPLIKLEADGLQWQTYGFPDANPRDGMVQAGSLENHDATLDGAHSFQLFSHQAAAGSGAPVKGLSGAPVVIEDAAVGLLRFALMKDGQTVAGTVYACSIAALVDRAGEFLKVYSIDDWRAQRQRRRRRLRMIWSAGLAAVVMLFVAGAYSFFQRPAAPPPVVDADHNPRFMSIVPFRAVGPQTDRTLAAGMDDALRSAFYSSPDIEVVSRASTARFVQDDGADISEMGSELGVGSVLEGNVEQHGEELVAETWLVDVASGEEICRVRLVYSEQDLFELHSGLAKAVAVGLGVELKTVARSGDDRSVDAYLIVVRGDEFLDAAFEKGADIRKILQPHETDLAIEQYQLALEIQREPATLARLSQAYSLKGLSGGAAYAALAEEAFEEALEGDKLLAEGHFARGLYMYWHERDYGSALWWFQTALKHGDGERIEYFAGLAARRLGNWTEAHEHFNRAARLDPLAWEKPFEYGRTSLLIRDYEEAYDSFGYSLGENADTPFPYLMRAMTLMSWKGDVTGAQDAVREWILDHDVADLLAALMVIEHRPLIRLLDEGMRRTLNQVNPADVENGDTARFMMLKAEICRSLGRTDEQQEYLTDALEVLETNQAERESLHHLDVLALAHTGLGNRSEALEAASQAAELRPISADHHRGAVSVTSSLLTEVYMTLEEHDLALQHLDQLLKNPSYMSINWVEADPLFEPLRDDERLQQLLDEGQYPTLLDEVVDGPPVAGGRVLDRLRERRDAEREQ